MLAKDGPRGHTAMTYFDAVVPGIFNAERAALADRPSQTAGRETLSRAA